MDLSKKLAVAWSRVRGDRSTDFILGDFEYHVYHRYHKELLDTLEARLRAEGLDYSPKPLRTIRVPKGGHTTRPGAVPEIDDRVVFQAVVDGIADAVEPNLVPVDDGVLHSYRYAGDRTAKQMFGKTPSFGTFDMRTVELASTHKLVVTTDIATFYERIYHHVLENTLRGLGARDANVQFALMMLRKWQKGVSYGIPQGIWPSDYLGNLYLDPIDKYMVRAGLAYCRYVDDIRIAVDTKKEAERALLVLEERLASLGLALNSAKTHVLEAEKVEPTLFPHRARLKEIQEEIRDLFDAIEVDIDWMSPYEDPDPDDLAELEMRIESGSLRALFREQLEEEEPEPRILRYCLKRLRGFQDDTVVNEVLDSLDKLLLVTQRVVPYLATIAKYTAAGPDISQRVADYVKDERPTYDWHTMWLMQCLERIGNLPDQTVSQVRSLLLEERDLHPAVEVAALLLVGRHGDDADRMWIRDRFDKTYDPWVRRAILYAIRGLPATERNHFYKYCRGQDPLTDKTIEYVLSGA